MSVQVFPYYKPKPPLEKDVIAEFKENGFTPYHVVMQKGEQSGVLQQNFKETRVLVSGKVELSADGRRYDLLPGYRVDISKGTPFVAKNLENGQSVFVCVKGGTTVEIEVY